MENFTASRNLGLFIHSINFYYVLIVFSRQFIDVKAGEGEIEMDLCKIKQSVKNYVPWDVSVLCSSSILFSSLFSGHAPKRVVHYLGASTMIRLIFPLITQQINYLTMVNAWVYIKYTLS